MGESGCYLFTFAFGDGNEKVSGCLCHISKEQADICKLSNGFRMESDAKSKGNATQDVTKLSVWPNVLCNRWVDSGSRR